LGRGIGEIARLAGFCRRVCGYSNKAATAIMRRTINKKKSIPPLKTLW